MRLMGDVVAVVGRAAEVLLRALVALLALERDLVGVAGADVHDVALATHVHQGGEGEAAAALDDRRDAVDLDDPLLQVEAGGTDGAVDVLGDAHTTSPPSRTPSAKALTRPWYW